MEIEISYNGKSERKKIITEQEAMGLRMLHDNFSAAWKKGDESRGVMIFTDTAPVQGQTARDMWAEIDKLKIKVANLEKI